jgi:hypothetical protein
MKYRIEIYPPGSTELPETFESFAAPPTISRGDLINPRAWELNSTARFLESGWSLLRVVAIEHLIGVRKEGDLDWTVQVYTEAAPDTVQERTGRP